METEFPATSSSSSQLSLVGKLCINLPRSHPVLVTAAILIRVVDWPVRVWIYGGLETKIVKEKVESKLDPNPKSFRKRFLDSGIKTRTIYGTSLEQGSDRDRE